MNNHKKGNKLLRQTLLLGILYLFIGSTLAYGIFISKDYFGFFNTLSLLTGAALGFIGSFYIERGGTVNYYFRVHTPTSEEKELDSLIAKNRSELLIILIFLVFMVAIWFLYIPSFFTNYEFNFSTMFGMVVGSFISMLTLCNGVKFVTAWVNIKRN